MGKQKGQAQPEKVEKQVQGQVWVSVQLEEQLKGQLWRIALEQ